MGASRQICNPLALLLLTCCAFAVRAARLFENPTEPCGWDGYYYVVQVERLVGEGRLHAPDGSWVLYALGAIGRLVEDPIFAVKVGASLLAALVVPAAFLLGWQLVRHSLLGAWLLAAWAAASPTLMHLSGDFPKNLGAVAPLLVALAAAQAFAHTRNRRWLVAALAAAVIAATAHRLGAALLLLSALGALLGFRAIRGLLLLVVGGALAFFVASALLPNLLRPEDLARVAPQLSIAPALNPWPYFSLRETGWLERVELLVAWPALVIAVGVFLREPKRRAVLGSLALPLLACVLPFWRSDVLDLGYRLSLMGPLFALPIFVTLLPDASLHWLWTIAAFALTPVARTGFDPQATPPYGVYREVIAAIPRPLPQLLIAHQGLNFLYDHQTGHEAMAWAPEAELDRTQIGRLAWGITDGEWLEFPPAAGGPPITRLSAEYVYLREDQWEQFVADAQQRGSDELAERLRDPRNIRRVRPASFRRNR